MKSNLTVDSAVGVKFTNGRIRQKKFKSRKRKSHFHMSGKKKKCWMQVLIFYEGDVFRGKLKLILNRQTPFHFAPPPPQRENKNI